MKYIYIFNIYQCLIFIVVVYICLCYIYFLYLYIYIYLFIFIHRVNVSIYAYIRQWLVFTIVGRYPSDNPFHRGFVGY